MQKMSIKTKLDAQVISCTFLSNWDILWIIDELSVAFIALEFLFATVNGTALNNFYTLFYLTFTKTTACEGLPKRSRWLLT